MATTVHRAGARGRAHPFDVASIGGPSLPRDFETFDVRSVPKSWAGSARHHDLRPGDRVLIDWARRPALGSIGAIRGEGGEVRFIVFDEATAAAAAVGRLVSPSRLLQMPAS